MIRSYIRGGNGFIRSSIACHLICIILLNRRSFHKKCPLTKADNISGLRIPQNWLLHFHRKFNLAIPSRFPGSRINVLFPLLIHMYNGFWKIAPLLQWPDRSGLSPDSLFWLLRGKQPALHMFNMELYWCYLTTSLYKCQGIPNKIPPLFKF